MREQTITIPWFGPTLNSLWAGKHWSYRKKVADEAHLAVKAVANRVKPFTSPVELSFIFKTKGRRYDCSNCAVTVKAIEDGLVLCGVLPNDGPDMVRRITMNAPEKIKTESFVRVIIKEVKE